MCCMAGTGLSNNRPAREAEGLVLAQTARLAALVVPVSSLEPEGSLESPCFPSQKANKGTPTVRWAFLPQFILSANTPRDLLRGSSSN